MTEQQEIAKLQADMVALRNEFHAYKLAKQQEESRRLRTALIWAGGIILALGGFVWWEIIWPVIEVGRGR